MSHSLSIDALELRYPGASQAALRGINLDVAPGDILCFLGPSGCGKTSLLRAIAGFVRPSRGRIRLGDEVLFDRRTNLPPESRRIGVVFQDYALFPHLTLEHNLLFGLTQGRPARASEDDRRRAATMLDLVGLESQRHSFPHELSGGQQQRVALARALAPGPALILMDEPFSNLDQGLRARLALDVREILKATGTTAILVTHDQAEAFAMADQLAVMFAGQIQQIDTPYRVYHEPCSAEVAQFVGEGTMVAGVRDGHWVETPMGRLPLRACCCRADAAREPVRVLLRPDDVVHDDDSPLTATVVAKAFRGADFLYTLRLGTGEEILSLVPSHHNHPIGEPIGLKLEADHVVTFPVAA